MTIWGDIAKAYGDWGKGEINVEKRAGKGYAKASEGIGDWLAGAVIPGYSKSREEAATSPASEAASAKSIAEQNVAEMAKGNASIMVNGKQEFVPQNKLTPTEQQEERTQSNQAPADNPVTGGSSTTSPESAYEQLANAQADQYLQMTKNLDPLTSGATLPAIEATASSNAEQMLGASSTSPVSQWLNAQTQAAQAQNAPAAAAEGQLGQAESAAANMEAYGLQNMGQAETQLMQAAPYQQLLQSLAADVPYKILGGQTLQSILPEVKTGEASLGLSTAGTPSVGAQGGSSGVLPFPTAAVAGVAAPAPTSVPNPVTGQ